MWRQEEGWKKTGDLSQKTSRYSVLAHPTAVINKQFHSSGDEQKGNKFYNKDRPTIWEWKDFY